MRTQFYNYICDLQDTITSAIEKVDGQARFQEDLWDRPEGGGGRTRVIENGAVFEKEVSIFLAFMVLTGHYANTF